MNKQKQINVKAIVGLGMLSAIVIVFQLISGSIHFGQFSVTLVLVPIVIGSASYGIAAGAWLGLVFSLAVFLTGDANSFLSINVIGTILTVLLKGVLAGLSAAAVYKLLCKKNQIIAIAASSVVCPVVNTGVFLLGCAVFFMPTIREWAGQNGFGDNVAAFMFVGLAGLNFLFELAVNILLNPAIHRILTLLKRKDRLL